MDIVPDRPSPVSGALGFLVSGVPRLSKSIATILFGFYLIGLVIPSSASFFALVPAHTIPPHFYVWNIFTAAFFDVSLLNTLISAITVLMIGRYLEPIWGSREFLKFILVINALTGLTTFLMIVFLYSLTTSETLIFSELCGFAGIIGAFAVALKQLIPDQELKLAFIPIRAKSLPFLVLCISLMLYVLGVPQQAFPFIPFGIFFSWVYLRFYQRKGDVVGDLNDSFSFASFFPDILQPPLRTLSSVSFNVLRLCGCCAHIEASFAAAAAPQPSLPGPDPDAERRRLRALQALDKRMAELKQAPATTSTPTPDQIPGLMWPWLALPDWDSAFAYNTTPKLRPYQLLQSILTVNELLQINNNIISLRGQEEARERSP